jgi:hypothetical protein
MFTHIILGISANPAMHNRMSLGFFISRFFRTGNFKRVKTAKAMQSNKISFLKEKSTKMNINSVTATNIKNTIKMMFRKTLRINSLSRPLS